MDNYQEHFTDLLKKTEAKLNATEKHVLEHLKTGEPISRNPHEEFSAKLTFGQKVADKIAAFGGSWPFIGIFGLVMLLWIGGNTFILLNFHKKPFDPFPFILLNLILSMLAAIQAPVIMMSQNRQADHDRLDAQHDYEVNLKSELEIMSLHQKLDTLREQQWEQLIELQRRQIDLLEKLQQQLATANTNKTTS
ncbi:MAG TPA: DUF1003 domain-containing protein [Candidatus Cloacimonadota bacterium]|nr:DUF1003 domain-containing protein [Candidatus Cloacimonadota bacterium]